MPSTFTSGLRLTNQGEGENAATWGIIADNNFEFIDDAISGIYKANMTGSASYTLTTGNGSADEARNAVIEIYGIPTSANSVIIPASEKVYQVRAYHTSITGGITVRTATGTGVKFLAGESATLECDGTSVYNIGTVSALDPSDNLSDLQNVSAARVNLSVYSTDQTDAYVSVLNALVSNTVSAVNSALACVINASDMVNVSNAGTFGGSLFYLRDEKSPGTNGGSYSGGTWTTRDLNTIKVSAPWAKLNSNIVTLASGNYIAEWRTPGYAINSFKSRLLNQTETTVIDEGTSEYSPLPGNDAQNSTGFCFFTVSVSTSIALQIQGPASKSDTGLGVAGNVGTYELYSLLKIWKRGN